MTHRTVRHKARPRTSRVPDTEAGFPPADRVFAAVDAGNETIRADLDRLTSEDRALREAIDNLSAEGERIVRRLLNRMDAGDRRFRERLARVLDAGDLDALAAILRKKGATVDAALSAARRRARGKHGR